MSFQAGAIVTRIGGDTGPLRGAFAQAKGMAGQFVSQFAGILSAGIGAALGVHALSSAMEGIDNAAKAADRLGLTAEAYTALAHQADLAGIDVESLGMSLQFLQKSLSDAAAGTGTGKAALDGLGLSGKQLLALPLEQAVGRIADQLNDVANPAQRAAMAMDLFGARGGPRLLALLSEGSEGVRQAREDADRLGITLSRLDETKVEEANDAMTNLGAAARGLATQLAVRLSPAIKAAVDLTTNLIVGVRGLDPVLLSVAGSSLKWAAAIGAAVVIAPRLVAIGSAVVKMYQSIAKGEAIVLALGGPKGWATLAAGIVVAAGAVWAIDKAFASTAEHATASAKSTAAAAAAAKAVAATQAPKIDFTDRGLAERTKAQWEVIGALQRQRDEAGKTREAVALMDLAWAGASREVMEYARQAIGATKAAETLADLRKRVEQFGMTDGQKAMADLRATPGVDPRSIGQAEELLGRLEKLDKNKSLADQAKQFLEGIRTPAEKAMDVVNALESAFRQGKITAEQFDKGLTAAADQAKQGIAADAKKNTRTQDLPTLIRANSAEAVRVAFQAQQSARDNAAEKSFQSQQLGKLDTLIAAVKENKVEVAMTGDD